MGDQSKFMGFWAFASFGLLVGFFVGMSVNPTVGGVAAALVGGGVGLLVGKSPSASSTASKSATLDRNYAERALLVFSLTCLVAALLGMFCRNYRVFEVQRYDLRKEWSEWKKAGLSSELALQAVLSLAKSDAEGAAPGFYGESTTSYKSNLSPVPGNTVATIDNWKREGGALRGVALSVEFVQDAELQQELLEAVWVLVEEK